MNDPLLAIAAMVPFESFRPKLKAALTKGELRRNDAERKSSAGRKPRDEVVILMALALQALYNLSDDQVEYQLRDPLSFMRFLGLGLEDAVAKAGAAEELFDLFDGFLKDEGYVAMGGQIIDATIVSAPKQHNSREENGTIKDGARLARGKIRMTNLSIKCAVSSVSKGWRLRAGEPARYACRQRE